jgi:PHB de-polymerase C-terminus
MAENADPAQPRSMTLMAGPIDTRVNPTEVNRLATSRSIEWFERKLIGIVPLRYPGALRRVYPGFVQLAAFMSMNLQRHVKAQVDLFCHLANGEEAQAAAIRAFYDEYCAVMDLPAEFYLQVTPGSMPPPKARFGCSWCARHIRARRQKAAQVSIFTPRTSTSFTWSADGPSSIMPGSTPWSRPATASTSDRGSSTISTTGRRHGVHGDHHAGRFCQR